jgi:hypothetical protein
MLRDRRIIGFRRKGDIVVPSIFFAEVDGIVDVVKGLTGTITLLRDHQFDETEILQWLFEADESLPGTPAEALHANRGKEVTRRAQASG